MLYEECYHASESLTRLFKTIGLLWIFLENKRIFAKGVQDLHRVMCLRPSVLASQPFRIFQKEFQCAHQR